MANLRTIKKDVIYMVNEVISDCWVYSYLREDGDMEEVSKIVSDAMDMGEELFIKINDYPRKGAKAYFAQINQELMSRTDELFKRISALAQKK